LSFCLLSRSLPSLCLVLTLTSTCLISTLVLHDALPICPRRGEVASWSSRPMPRKYGPCPVLKSVMPWPLFCLRCALGAPHDDPLDRKSTRLNSSHVKISYAVFCLKKKIITNSTVTKYAF